jgi:hypothetical protein
MSPSFFIEKTRSREKADERELLLFIDGIVDELSLVLGKKKSALALLFFSGATSFAFHFFFLLSSTKAGGALRRVREREPPLAPSRSTAAFASEERQVDWSVRLSGRKALRKE